MAKATKGARHSVVGNVKYRWRATGNDGYIVLTVWPAELEGPAIVGLFDYGHELVPMGDGRVHGKHQIVITARIVRRVLEYAVRLGYDAAVRGKQLDLGRLDARIDLSDALRSSE